ncbi:hypothetical protein [Bacteroides phage Versailles]|nr:hypothetical protein [Bacteroides phage Versailles]
MHINRIFLIENISKSFVIFGYIAYICCVIK